MRDCPKQASSSPKLSSPMRTTGPVAVLMTARFLCRAQEGVRGGEIARQRAEGHHRLQCETAGGMAELFGRRAFLGVADQQLLQQAFSQLQQSARGLC